jgi:hypothetical protein
MKRYAISVLALGAMFLAGSLLESRGSKAKAIYATPVSISNPTTSPGFVYDANAATRIPYEAKGNPACGTNFCSFFFTAPPVGYRLVVQNVSGRLTLTSTTPPVALLQSGDSVIEIGVPTSVGGNINTTMAGFNQNVLAFFDPSNGGPILSVEGDFSPAAVTGQLTMITGYLENCSVTGCQAVQH